MQEKATLVISMTLLATEVCSADNGELCVSVCTESAKEDQVQSPSSFCVFSAPSKVFFFFFFNVSSYCQLL